MIATPKYWLACAAVLAAAQSFALCADAQPVTRVKAKLVALNGDVMTLQPLSAQPLMKSETPPADSTAPAGSLTVTLTADTRYVASQASSFSAIKPGDYAGAAVSEGRGGALRASDVYVYADALRGTGEGRFPDNGRLLVNGTVTGAEPINPQQPNGGTMTLHYRGAVLSPTGKGRAVCEGRAAPAPYASPLACSADAAIEVTPSTPLSLLAVGERSLLAPGAIVSVTIAKRPDGRSFAPGVVVEQSTVEKPQSPH